MALVSPAPGGRGNRPQSDGPGQARVEAAHRRRRARHSAGHHGYRCQPARFDGIRAHARCHSRGIGPEWPAPQTPGQAACGQRLRLCSLSELPEAPRHHGPYRPSRRGKQGGGSDGIAGSSSALMRGVPVSANCAFASSVVSTFMLRCFPLPLPSSVHASLMTCVNGSKRGELFDVLKVPPN